MSKKIDYGHNKKIENNSFGNGTQIADVIVNNCVKQEKQDRAEYKPEPVWRSPFTLAVLTWMSFIIGILSLLPLGKIIKSVAILFSGSSETLNTNDIQISSLAFVVLFLLLMITLTVRRIANLQTRHPLICNFAINGYGKKIVIEKIHAEKCPKCGGKMKYYNKPIEWVDKLYSDGKVKREVTKRVPVLECKRNSNHYYVVDYAEDRV